MATVWFTKIHVGLMLAMTSSVLLVPSVSEAYTAEQQQACTPDAFRLCSSEIPNVDNVTLCMIRKKSQLSPACRMFFKHPEQEAEAVEGKSLAPATIRKHRPKKPSRPDDT